MTDRQTEKERTSRRTSRRQGRSYQGATEAVFSILIATGIGYWADGHFDTSPRYLLIGVAVGFGSFVLRLLRLGRQLEAMSAEDEENGEES